MLSTNPPFCFLLHPRCLPCRLLRSTHVFPGIGQGMRFAILFGFFPPFFIFLFYFSFSPSALTPASTSGRNRETKREASRKKATEKEGMYKGWMRIFARKRLRGRALWNAIRAIREITISPLKLPGRCRRK